MTAIPSSKTRQRKKQRAFILLPVILTLTILAAVAYLLSREGAINAGNVNREQQQDAALYIAQAGYNHAVWKLNRQNCTGYAGIPVTTLGDHSYLAEYTDTTGSALTAGSPANIKVVGTLATGETYTISRDRETVYQGSLPPVTLQLGTDPGKDTLIDSFYNNRNHGDYEQGVSAEPAWLRYQFIQFDLSSIPAEASIVSAQLELKQTSTVSAGADAKISVHRVKQSWVEGTKAGGGLADGATWDTADGSLNWDDGSGGSYDATSIASTDITGANVLRNWDISTLVQDWHNGLYTNDGLMLKGSGTVNVTFASKEDSTAANRPKLIISYNCECGKSCAPEAPLIPIAHWKLDEISGTTAVDSIGGHDGTLINAPSWTAGNIDGGLDFDGVDDLVDTGSNVGLDDLFAGGATMTAWINPRSWGEGGFGRIADKADALGTNRNGWAFELYSSPRALLFQYGFSGAIGNWYTPTDSITLNTWQHVAVVYDNSSDVNDPLIYIDGVLQTLTEMDTPSGTASSDATVNLTIGNYAVDLSRTFDGLLDDIRIYDQILTESEIADLAGISPPPSAGVIFEEFTEAELGSNGISLTINKPAGTVAGDLLIAAVVTDGNNASSLAPPAGWNVVHLGDSGGKATFGVWWKIASASESSSYTFSWSNNEQAYGWIMRFTGHDPASPIDVDSNSVGSSSAPSSSSVVTTIANTMILRLGGFDDDDVTAGAPGLPGYTAINMGRSGIGALSASGGSGYILQPVAGDSGVSSFTLTNSEQYVTVTIAIAPAP